MLDKLIWLGKREELEFRKLKFHGKDAAKIFKYSNHIDGLIRTRAIIVALVLLIFYPVFINYLQTGQLYVGFFIERLIASLIFLTSYMLFNKIRIISILLAAIPMILIIGSYFIIDQYFNIYNMAYSGAVLFLILSGLYHNYKSKKLEKELSHNIFENHLIESDE